MLTDKQADIIWKNAEFYDYNRHNRHISTRSYRFRDYTLHLTTTDLNPYEYCLTIKKNGKVVYWKGVS